MRRRSGTEQLTKQTKGPNVPLYYFQCPAGHRVAKILKPTEVDTVRKCNVVVPGEEPCSLELRRDPHPPTSQVTEVIDNGLMVRAVERYPEAGRLFQEKKEIAEKQRKG